MINCPKALGVILITSSIPIWGTASADGSSGVPSGTKAMLYRIQAEANRNGGQGLLGTSGSTTSSETYIETGRSATVYVGSSFYNTGTGNLNLGVIDTSRASNLREVNVLVNGDVINWNNSR